MCREVFYSRITEQVVKDILDEDDFLDPFGALTKVKVRKIIMVIFISNFVSSLQCFAGLA